MACWRYIEPWGEHLGAGAVPGSLQEIVPSNAKKEWRETKRQASHMIRKTNFKWQGPHSEVPVMHWKHEV